MAENLSYQNILTEILKFYLKIMNPVINDRFIECVNETISESKTSKTDIAKNLKIGRTKLSEILNRRMNVSIDTLSAFCLLYGYDPIWMIFGEGTKEEKMPQNIDYKEIVETKEVIIQSQNKQITLLEAQLKDKEDKESLLKDKITDLEKKLELFQLKDKEAMDAKIEIQRAKLQAKKTIISEKDEIIFRQNEEINAMKTLHQPTPHKQSQPSKGS